MTPELDPATQRPVVPTIDPATGRPPGLPSAEEMVKRIMQNDKNGDGKLSPEEFPAQLREEAAIMDTNKDGFIDKPEVEAFAKAQEAEFAKMRGNRAAPRVRGAGGGPQDMEGAMKQSNRGFKGLEESEFDASSKKQDLESIQLIQAGLVAAKGLIGTAPMAPQAKAKFGDDTEKYQLAMRTELIETLNVAIALEQAVLANDSKTAKSLYEKLSKEQDEGHELFKKEEEDRKPPTSPANAPPSAPAPGGKK